jgi:putative DNA primase/helicase
VTIPENERDGNLPDKLREELPGILNWMIQGCLAWQTNGLQPPTIVTDAGKGYRDEMDLVAQFVDDCCVVDRKAETTVAELYRNYTEWCHDNGEQILSKREFGSRLNDLGYADRRTGIARKRRGIKIKTEVERMEALVPADDECDSVVFEAAELPTDEASSTQIFKSC